ncbi:MAG: hypothetical protein R2764_06380 [Bacteroidales bacterium]
MKTITIISMAVDAYAFLFGSINPILIRTTTELNEHVKRKQNE